MTNDHGKPKITFLHKVDNFQDDNVDAIILLPGGEVRTATFFTLENIASIIKSYRATGECLSGRFFWAKDMVIVENLRPETIEAIVFEMVRSGEVKTAFGLKKDEEN